jgi:hypothetical protein
MYNFVHASLSRRMVVSSAGDRVVRVAASRQRIGGESKI